MKLTFNLLSNLGKSTIGTCYYKLSVPNRDLGTPYFYVNI